jgi:23S rRNA (adenine1618-N6)-methyltransferase
MTKSKLHPRNKNRSRYDFEQLISTYAPLNNYVHKNAYDDLSIDFFDPAAVKALNKALLMHFYGITYWDIPENYLCPPIPGRADYLHYVADLLSEHNNGAIPTGNNITCLDIGVGANCIYPIIGINDYGWSFIGTDIDPVAVESANKIIKLNPQLKSKVSIRLQTNPPAVFKRILLPGEKIDITICNPPFHTSLNAAKTGTLRKLSNLTKVKNTPAVLNFSGQPNELWCDGGELQFIKQMILESKEYSESCCWFTTLVSKEAHLKKIYHLLEDVSAVSIRTVPMGQGNKISRIVAWSFLSAVRQRGFRK